MTISDDKIREIHLNHYGWGIAGDEMDEAVKFARKVLAAYRDSQRGPLAVGLRVLSEQYESWEKYQLTKMEVYNEQA